MPVSLWTAQKRPRDSPSLLKEGREVHPGCSHRRVFTSTMPVSLWTAQKRPRDSPSLLKTGCKVHPGCSHRRVFTSTMPGSLWTAQKRPRDSPSLLKTGREVHPGCSHRRFFTSTMPGSLWAAQKRPRDSPSLLKVGCEVHPGCSQVLGISRCVPVHIPHTHTLMACVRKWRSSSRRARGIFRSSAGFSAPCRADMIYEACGRRRAAVLTVGVAPRLSPRSRSRLFACK